MSNMRSILFKTLLAQYLFQQILAFGVVQFN